MTRFLRCLILLCALLFASAAKAQYFKPVWVNDVGGTSDSKSTNIASDNNGNIYISGYIRGTVTFNLKEGGSKTLTSNGDADVYIAKYNTANGNYEWAISFGGSGLEQPNSMTVDNQGNVLITGQYQSTVNFNPAGNFPLTSNGSDDIFIAKYTSTGAFVWAKSMGGGDIDRGHYITTDAQNNVFITASYTGAVDADPSAAVNTLPNQGSLSCFFAKYDANGNFVWAHPLGVVNQQNLTAIAIDKTTNDVVITGDFSGNVDFSYTGQAGAAFNSPRISNFVARYTNNGVYKWVKYLPGSGSGILSSLKIDNLGNIVITGNFGGQFYANGPTGTALVSKGVNDILVASYKSDGTLNWAENFGSTSSDAASRYVTVDENNNIYITGYFTGTVNIDPTLSNGVLNTTAGGRSILIASFSPAGKPLASGAFGSGCTSNLGYEIAAFGGGVYVTGAFCGTEDFDTGTCQTDNITAVNGTSDSFLAKYTIVNDIPSIINSFTLAQQISPATIDQVNHIITVTVAPGTNVKSLSPVITVTNNGTLSPASGTTQDFSSPFIYTDASGCTSVPYTVKVILAVAKTLTTCSGASNVITGDVATPTPDSYVWQEFQTPTNTWANAPGVINGKDYQTSALTNSTASNVVFHLRRQITTGGVVSYDSFYDVTVQPSVPVAANTLTAPSPATLCGPYNPGAPGQSGAQQAFIITGSTPTGGTGTYTYQWQSSTDNITFTDISGQTTKDLTVPAVNVTTYFRRVVTSGTCAAPSTSNLIIITILPVIANDAITAPAVNTFCSTGDPGIITGSTPTGGTGVYTYQWQSSADNVTFTDITGAIAKDYDPSVISSTTYFRRTVVSGPCNTPLISNVVTMTVIPAIANNVATAPSVTTFCVNGDPAAIVGSVPTGGDGTYNYQWQSSSNNVTFTNIPGATLKDYDPVQISTTTYYRRTVTSGACSTPLVGNVVTITVLPVVANNTITPPAVTTFCGPGDPGTITGSVPTGGNGTYFYQWQSSPDGINFTDIPGGSNISKDLVIALISTTTYYRRTVISDVCNVPLISNVVEIIVSPAVANNTITAPSVINFCLTGDPGVITGTTPSGGNSTYTYQWQSSTDNVNFTNISGATAQSFDPPAVNATTYFRRTVNSGTCTPPSLSNVISVIIASPPSAPVISNPTVAICPGNTATISITSPQQGFTYDWYDSPSKINHLFTGTSYTTNPLNTNTTFYVQATNASCSSPLATAQINVSSVPVAPSVVVNTVPVCSGSVATLNIANPQAGLTYNWYTSSTGGSSVFTGTSFVTSALTTNTIYYAEAVNGGGCTSATRTPVNVTVNAIPQITAQGTSICSGTSTNLTATSSDQNAAINWYISASGGNALFTGGTFSTPNLNANTTYYVEAANNTTGCTSARTAVQVQMIQPLAAPVVTLASTTTSSVTFQWDAVSGATGYQVSIDGGQTFVDPSSGSSGLTHTIDGLQAEQSVTIQVRATGNASCALSASSTAVTGTAASPLGDQIFVPNAFTPNGDGKNDVVYVHSENIKSLKFYVYDQWGELLYTSLKQENGWDGTYRGTREPVGVYVYYVEAIMNDGHQVTKKGTITLIR